MIETPIPGFDLSPAAFFALADLHSIPDRTAFRGGVSIFEVLILAPGLQYQQSADTIYGLYTRFPKAFETGQRAATSEGQTPTPDPAGVRHWPVHNHATLRFLQRVVESDDFPCSVTPLTTASGDDGRRLEESALVGNNGWASTKRVWTFNVGLEVWPEMIPSTTYLDALRKRTPQPRPGSNEKLTEQPDHSVKEDRAWILAEIASHFLYLCTPLLTISAVILCIVSTDWWGFSVILMLIFSRAINIMIIEERHDPDSVAMDAIPIPVMAGHTITVTPFEPASVHTTTSAFALPSTYWNQRRSRRTEGKARTEYTIPLSPTSIVVLRGTRQDLQAVTTCGFLSPLSRRQGLLEGVAKSFMYLAAALSGNLSQMGAIALAILLLTSASMLGISNFFVRCLRVNGRVMYPTPANHRGARSWDPACTL
ncbi:hypothetical protein SODALDRAFT_66345 [Sodiomyces alkalinus F11]|uniref:Uncharacterized protein n=1 Tax=Sodiomyces alkalinus (strain CBS 110278 / VKM F-3762 / F11) TaxID=1314773 RepID=A0A3N2PLU2_SODAK|nr:hypothetical protein SODALDRAFT_66345 [Sodiomyces alkalinus F11]ROT35449.1 hypothetical protein SODALDRAFT_66345 [Sodiomyces alkalinus F11]